MDGNNDAIEITASEFKVKIRPLMDGNDTEAKNKANFFPGLKSDH